MPRQVPSEPVTLFYSYASTEDGIDEKLQQQLEKHLGVLKRQGKIANWHKRNILAGEIISEEINRYINTAQIILLLISPDFVASDDCWDIEMARALERQKEEKTLVIPVLLRPLDYKDAPFSNLRVLPKNGKPITSWTNQDEAFEDIARNIRLLAERFEETGKISWQGLGTGVAFAVAIATLITSSTANTAGTATTQSFPVQEKLSGPIYTVKNTYETLPDGIYFRGSRQFEPSPPIPIPPPGFGVWRNERVRVSCWAWGKAVSGNYVWYYVSNVSRPTIWNGRLIEGWLNAHYVNDGMTANHPAPGIPQCRSDSQLEG
jgi:TIR domain